MSEENRVTIEINGEPLQAEAGSMLIDVADQAGIPIPRFCYHSKLSVAANCRMCLVEVEGVAKPLPACATAVTAGMKVQTRSKVAVEAQKGTMEFLLINHPLDCPICDQGGECELQDVAMGYGADKSRYVERKRVVPDPDLGPLIATEFTRCIHCTRCVRFGEEIAGIRELGATGRGEHTRIGTYVAHTVQHELSGNVIDLCPVGALTAKPSRFRARAWELTQVDGISPHDAVGSALHLHVRRGEIVRVHPRVNEDINETWIADRDRFSYQGLVSGDRLTQPWVKRQGKWLPIRWEDALEYLQLQLKDILRKYPGELGTLVSPNCTLEEMYLARKLTHGLGSQNIDHRLRQTDFRMDGSSSGVPGLGVEMNRLAEQKCLLVVGSLLRKEQPILAHRIRQAALQGARVTVLNPLQQELAFPAEQVVVKPSAWLGQLLGLAKLLGVADLPQSLQKAVASSKPAKPLQALAEQLQQGQGSCLVMLGHLAQSHPDYAWMLQLSQAISLALQGTLAVLGEGANCVGAHLVGALPGYRSVASGADHEAGLSVQGMLAHPLKSYMLVGAEPDRDFADAGLVARAFQDAEFVVALSSYRSEALDNLCDLLLPVAAPFENEGTLVNMTGRWQGFTASVAPPESARPAWKVLRVIGNMFDLDGFGQVNASQVRDEMRDQCAAVAVASVRYGMVEPGSPRCIDGAGLRRIAPVPLYASDATVRRAADLQAMADAGSLQACVNPKQFGDLGLTDEVGEIQIKLDGETVTLPCRADDAVPEDSILIPAAIAGVEAIGAPYDLLEVAAA